MKCARHRSVGYHLPGWSWNFPQEVFKSPRNLHAGSLIMGVKVWCVWPNGSLGIILKQFPNQPLKISSAVHTVNKYVITFVHVLTFGPQQLTPIFDFNAVVSWKLDFAFAVGIEIWKTYASAISSAWLLKRNVNISHCFANFEFEIFTCCERPCICVCAVRQFYIQRWASGGEKMAFVGCGVISLWRDFILVEKCRLQEKYLCIFLFIFFWIFIVKLDTEKLPNVTTHKKHLFSAKVISAAVEKMPTFP